MAATIDRQQIQQIAVTGVSLFLFAIHLPELYSGTGDWMSSIVKWLSARNC